MPTVELEITDSAQTALEQLLADRKAEYVRLSAGQACGCGRIGYQMHWEEAKDSDDVVVPTRGLDLVIGLDSVEYLNGGRIDYRREDMQEGFIIENPTIPSGCSCGSH